MKIYNNGQAIFPLLNFSPQKLLLWTCFEIIEINKQTNKNLLYKYNYGEGVALFITSLWSVRDYAS